MYNKKTIISGILMKVGRIREVADKKPQLGTRAEPFSKDKTIIFIEGQRLIDKSLMDYLIQGKNVRY